MTIYLRSSLTGKVLTQEEWQHSLNEWEDEGGMPAPADEFFEVVKDDAGNWVEKKQIFLPVPNNKAAPLRATYN